MTIEQGGFSVISLTSLLKLLGSINLTDNIISIYFDNSNNSTIVRSFCTYTDAPYNSLGGWEGMRQSGHQSGGPMKMIP